METSTNSAGEGGEGQRVGAKGGKRKKGRQHFLTFLPNRLCGEEARRRCFFWPPPEAEGHVPKSRLNVVDAGWSCEEQRVQLQV